MAENAVNVAGTTSNTGNGVPFNIRNPYLGVNFIIALQGLFPPRNQDVVYLILIKPIRY
jgi:microcystin-dependent protein